MGMSYEDYWYGDVFMVIPYVEAYRLRKQQENERLWLQGLYFYDALSVALKRFGEGLAGKHSAGSVKYPEQPYPLWQREKTTAEIEAENEAERKRAHDYLDSIVKAYKRQKQEKETKEKT